jgi:hypothetical protein
VRVTTHEGEHKLWAAATSREEAVGRVLDIIPDQCSAHLLDERLKPRPHIALSMMPGEVRELSATGKRGVD